MEKCPQCQSIVEEPLNRLIQDSCGHKKCRICFLKDEVSCLSCNGNSQSVIKFDNSSRLISNVICDDQKNITCEKQSSDVNTSDQYSPEKRGINKETCNLDDKLDVDLQKRPYHLLEIPAHIVVLSERDYKCKICLKQFTTRSHIKYHKFCLGGKKPFSCDKCNKEFITKSHFDSHKLNHSGLKPFTCNICSKTFTQKSKLNRHIQLHSGSKPFMCQECGKSFRSRDYLKNHCLIHSSDKPFNCEQCNATFNNSSNFKKHIVSHSKEKVHMCDQCGKRFKLKWALTVHRRSHSSERPHQCNSCGKAFLSMKDLQRHELIHLDVKAYSCGVCKTSFRRKDNLDRHMRNTHPGKKVLPIKTEVKKISKPLHLPISTSVVDNPNAINVITTSLASQLPKKTEPTRHIPVINGPLKLAFKTSAFKSCYNIHRDYIEPQGTSHESSSINIYQKILSPPSPPESNISTIENDDEVSSNDICQKIMSPLPSSQLHYETSFEHKTHAIIKNIKFKLPSNYTNLKNDKLTDFQALYPISFNDDYGNEKLSSEEDSCNKTKLPTSVIVNTQINESYLRKRSILK